MGARHPLRRFAPPPPASGGGRVLALPLVYLQRGMRELVPTPPTPQLRGVVVEYRGFRDDAPAPAVLREPPSACVPVIIDLGSGWQVRAPGTGYRPQHLRGFAAGMHDAFALVEAAG